MTAPTARPPRRPFGARARRPGLPRGLAVEERVPKNDWNHYHGPVVVLVHGSLDRAASFARTALRLPDVAVVAYDRRGYQGSRHARPAAGIPTHVDDLRRIALAYAGAGPERRPVVAVGHSTGGTVVLGAAVAAPELFAAVGAYEPTMPWLGFRRTERHAGTGLATPATSATSATAATAGGAPDPGDPGNEAERFFKRVVGVEAWNRLDDAKRATRRADGPALVVDLRGVRGAPPFDVTALEIPTVVASGGPASFPHHRQTAEWLASHVASAHWTQVHDAGHGAHLSHPDAFAALVREVLAAGGQSPACD